MRCARPGFFFLAISFLAIFAFAPARAQQEFANLGDFKLVSGETIRDCRIGYRTKGALNADKSNAILVTAWFGGTSEKIIEYIGPGGVPDSSKYFVIVIDPLGNGVSSSPSNSKPQPHMKFPQFTIRDMVNSQHEVLTRFLHISHLKAVMGASMGGMQTFQWIVSYPDFMDNAIPIVGSPRLTAYDLMHWHAENDAIMHDAAWKGGDYTENPGLVQLAEFGALFATTPQYYNKKTSREGVQQALDKAAAGPAMDANDHIRTAQALIALDVSDAFDGSLDKAAAVVKAKVLVVASRQDHTVTAGPALEFAKKIHAEVLELNADCGHQLMECQGDKVTRAASAFLEK